MKELIEKESLAPFFRPPSIGDTLKGKVISKQRRALFLDLGVIGTGIIFGMELSLARQAIKEINIGDDVTTKVVDIDCKDGYVELSMVEAQREMGWQILKEKKEKKESFYVVVSRANKGGLMATVEGIHAFLPVSQLKPEHYPKVKDGDQSRILQKLQKLIGIKLKVVVLSLDREQKTLILSEKEANLEKVKEILKRYQVNDIVEGKIIGIVDFGAFIRFPVSIEDSDKKLSATEEGETVEGLIHISELDWQLIQDPSEVVKVGEIVRAKIIEISNGRVSLSLKALKEDPWQNIEKKYKKGDVVKGIVTKFNPFGAFIKIEPRIQGLIHVSEFNNEKEMKEVLYINKEYDFRIELIEPTGHRMILKLGQLISQTKDKKNEQEDKSVQKKTKAA